MSAQPAGVLSAGTEPPPESTEPRARFVIWPRSPSLPPPPARAPSPTFPSPLTLPRTSPPPLAPGPRPLTSPGGPPPRAGPPPAPARTAPAARPPRLAPPRAFQALFAQATARGTGGQHDADYAEPFGASTPRVHAALTRAAERTARGGTTLVVTSGGPVSLVVSRLLAGDASLWRALNPVTVNTGVTKVVSGRRGLTCVTFNAHDHLDATPALLTYR
ncbi:histidine phosphatase family protein, partial [Actinomadura sp. BRA 177]|uniref:histidine phosphatase family protein n=1 Tax=Actinomadura sp. BRA 177 TaxID=2745202 RepID=UPI001595DFB3